SREQLLGPGTQRRQIEDIAVVQPFFQNNGRSDALAPLRIGHTDHGTLGNCGMFAERVLNLQRVYFVSTRFENVDVRPAKNAIDIVFIFAVFIFDYRSIAGAKPTVAESGAGGL